MSASKGAAGPVLAPGLEVSAHTGSSLYRQVCRLLAVSFKCKFALVGRVGASNPGEIEVLAACMDGEAIPPFSYAIANTPCARTLEEGSASFVSGLGGTFPDSAELSEHGLESYAGQRVADRSGRVRGLVAVSDVRPLEASERVLALLEVFAQRVGAEFDREDVVAELERDRSYQAFLARMTEALLGVAPYRAERDAAADAPSGRHAIIDGGEFLPVLEMVAARFDAERVALYGVDAPSASTRRLAVWTRSGILPERLVKADPGRRDEAIDYMILGRGGEPTLYRANDPELPDPVRDMVALLGIPSCLVVPAAYETAASGDRWLGALVVGGSDVGRTFDAAELAELSTVARVLASAALRTEAERERERYARRLHEASVEMSITEERARMRIESELHDDVVQNLAALKILLSRARRGVGDADAAARLSEALELTEDTIAKTREIIAEDTPLVLRELGLFKAIEWLTRRAGTAAGLKVDCTIDSGALALPIDDATGILVFQTLRELVTNVRKHARANRLDVRCTAVAGAFELTVEDDGIGIGAGRPVRDPVRSIAERGHGFGLFSLRNRIEYFGGTFELGTRSGGGTRVVARIPATRTRPRPV